MFCPLTHDTKGKACQGICPIIAGNLPFFHLRAMGILAGETTLSECVLSPHQQGPTIKEKNLPHGEQILSFQNTPS